jgi:two-component system chemotaxis sensor kinase CheA
MKEEQLLQKLREAFKAEADERLKTISSSLVQLEEVSSLPDKQKPILEVIFREAHSLKGASRAVNLVNIEILCQSMESVFSALKKGEIPLTPELFDKLHYTVESIEGILMDPEKDQSPELQEEIPKILSLLESLTSGNGDGSTQCEGEKAKKDCDKAPAQSSGEKQTQDHAERKAESPANVVSDSKGKDAVKENKIFEAEESEKDEESRDHQDTLDDNTGVAPSQNKSINEGKPIRGIQAAQNRPLISGTVRISTEKLDALMRKAEELILLKLAESQHMMNLQDTMQSFDLWKKKWVKIESELRLLSRSTQKEEIKNQNYSSIIEFSSLLDWNQEHIQSLERKIRTLVQTSEHNHHSLGRMVDDLLDDMKMVTMLPFSTLFEILPRMVRDIARNQGKEVDLKLHGGDVEIDRRILEEMKDPIIHLLRNSIDHGIEDPALREESKKPRHGLIKFSITQTEGNKVEILFSDDGKGIDFERVKKEAAARGLISKKEEKNLKDHEALPLIFRSGVTTSPMITQISGRGLGLAIVQEKVEQLGGSLSLESNPGMGTTFRILLPVTMATFKGILVQAANNLFVVPTSHVERVVRIQKSEVKSVENNATIPLNGKTVSLVDLGDVLDLPQKENKEEESKYITVLILGVEEKQIAFKIDEVLTEQEVLVKSMGKQLSRVRNIAGATVLGSGEVVPILNAQDLLKSALKINFISDGINMIEKEAETQKKSILVVEDSITSRMLIKNILESYGYYVKTASDGLDGFNTLKAEDFDLVVSDVEMPNMSGFDLTAKIRGEKGISHIPVVLCTSLESKEDRERGVDVGANAYIVKSSFDQSNLLEVIKRLS